MYVASKANGNIYIYKYIVQYVLTYFSIDVLHDWSKESTNEIEELLQFCAGVVGRLKGVLIERYRYKRS